MVASSQNRSRSPSTQPRSRSPAESRCFNCSAKAHFNRDRPEKKQPIKLTRAERPDLRSVPTEIGRLARPVEKLGTLAFGNKIAVMLTLALSQIL